MCLSPIWTDKHETARRLAQRIKIILDVAKSKGFRSGENPVTAIHDAHVLPKVKTKPKHHKAMQWQEVPDFYADLKTRNAMAAKTIYCQFYPVDKAYHECFEAWVTYLREVKLFGPEDALFPKARVGVIEGKEFANMGLAREGFANGAKLNLIIRGAFAAVQLPQYTPHSFRKTLTHLGSELCKTPEQFKAWSMNMGHEKVATTMNSYLPISTERQMEIIRDMWGEEPASI